MQLSTIDIEGFKSFPKRTRLAFKPGITAVIGPNGSGKSNVTEAIRWVLGEQSIKQLRGQESRDVIFHGTSKQAAARRARVTLTFANESGRFPGEAAEVAITRSLSSDGHSQYLINGDDVRLLDLQRQLAEAGLGVRTFTVISQGMVDKYLTATPSARKELFDEATGVRSLQLQLHEAHRKLQKAQQHAAEIETIIRELIPRLHVLERQVKRYRERETLQATFKVKQLVWFSERWHQVTGQIEATTTQLKDLRATIAQARSRRVQLERTLLQPERDGSTQKLREQLLKAQASYEQQLQAFEDYTRKVESLTQSLADVKQRRAEAEAALAKARKTSQQYDLMSHANGLLKRCLEYLQGVINGQTNMADAKELMRDITAYVKQASATPAGEATQLMLRAIEAPLQEVARLSGLEEERQASLRQLKEHPVGKPSLEQVKQLQAQLAAVAAPTKTPRVDDLETARELELESERLVGGAEAALEGHRQALASIEENILRECGSSALENIRSGSVNPENVPTEAALRTLAAKLAAIGEPDPLVQKEYTEAKRRHQHLSKQLADVQTAATNIVDLMGQLHKQMQQQFDKQFTVIRQSFATIFTQLFGGGSAQIAQTEEGIDITVTPPGKRSRHVGLLSGGERALTSLALLLAILEAQNPPFIVLDEVDAALDEANSRRFAELLRQQCVKTQCLIVTHNREVMSIADVLYGITMAQEGISSVYSVQLSDIDDTVPEDRAAEQMQI